MIMLAILLMLIGLYCCWHVWLHWQEAQQILENLLAINRQSWSENQCLRKELEMSKKKEPKPWYENLTEINSRCCQCEGGIVEVDAQEGASYLAALGGCIRSLPAEDAAKLFATLARAGQS